ncbi:MAG: restriction endonuclease subunit S [Cyclobacteriaceae bacterium]|nr:restriction endonuclease subunit S [Cyclobacteriaceae bacterium]
MSKFTTYKLEEIAEVQTGPFGSQLHMSDYKKEGTPIITVEHLGENRIIHKNLPLVSNEDKNRLKKYTLKEGDIVFSRVGSVDRCAYVSAKEDDWMFSGRCLRVRTNDKVDSRFLSFYFNQESFKEYIRMIAVGATMPSINTTILSEVEIVLPPLKEQKLIAETLSSIDDKIDLLHRQNKTLEHIAETFFKDKLLDGGSNWQSRSFSFLIETTLGGDWGKETLEGDYIKAVNCIRGTDIADLQTGLANRAPLRFVKAKKYESIQPIDGDLILEISGGTDDQSTGRTIYINDLNRKLFPNPIVFSNFCRLIRPKQKEFSYFLYLYIQYLYNQDEFFNLENGSSGIKNLDYKYLLNSLEFSLPKDVNTVIAINEEVRIFFEKINKNKLQIQTLTKLRDTLLPKLIIGAAKFKN